MERTVTAVSLRQTYSAQVWKSRVTSCRSSGRSVKAWCAENAICVQTYYRWERKFPAEGRNNRRSGENGAFVELPIGGSTEADTTEADTTEADTAEADTTEADTTEADAVVAVLRAEGVECEIRSSITAELPRALVRSMNGHA